MTKTEPSPELVGRLRAWASDMRMFGSADQDLREAADEIERLSALTEAAEASESVAKRCDMGVGCEETGVCYAEAHGEPERCSLYTRPVNEAERIAALEALLEQQVARADQQAEWAIREAEKSAKLEEALGLAEEGLKAIYSGDEGPVLLRGRGSSPARCARKAEAKLVLQHVIRARSALKEPQHRPAPENLPKPAS